MFTPPSVDCAAVTDDELTQFLHSCAKSRAALDAFEARVLAEFDRRGTARAQGFPDSASWLSAHTRTANGVARGRVANAEILHDLPAFASALHSGDISSEHLNAIARAARTVDPQAVVADETRLIRWARKLDPEHFARKVRRWVLTHHTDHGDSAAEATNATRSASLGTNPSMGTGFLHADLPAEQHAIVSNALWALVDEQWRAEHDASIPPPEHHAPTSAQRLADALVEMARRAMATPSASRGNARPLVTVLIDYETLMGRLSLTGQCTLTNGDPLDARTARRLACEADILPVVLGGNSQPLDVGRSRRLATPGQRAAMLARSTTCEWPGCHTPSTWCQAHHLTPWEVGGPSDISNLAWMCTAHHHNAHEGGWRVTRNSGGTIETEPPPSNRSSGTTNSSPSSNRSFGTTDSPPTSNRSFETTASPPPRPQNAQPFPDNPGRHQRPATAPPQSRNRQMAPPSRPDPRRSLHPIP